MTSHSTMQLYANCRPKVLSGDKLSIEVEQTLAAPLVIDAGQIQQAQHLEIADPSIVTVDVHGPRCLLGPDDIAGQYPAPGSKDSPADFLCHVALNRRTLPWERRGPAGVTPWLALLLVKESELSTAGPGGAPGSKLERISVSDLGKPSATQDEKLLHSRLTSHAGTGPPFAEDDQIHVARLLRTTLAAILPFAPDLPLLCHMKRVTPGTKEQPTGLPTDVAIVIGNRLPTIAPDGSAEPHTALLVSLERRGDLYASTGDPAVGSGTDPRTPVVVLHHWSFTPSDGGDFENVMQEIRLQPNGGVLRFGNLPRHATPPVPAPLAGGFEALLDGAGEPVAPLRHARHGEAVYRGPLRPFQAPPRSKGFAIRAAPQELDADDAEPRDYSYAAAFEIGRLLALHDEGILEDLRGVTRAIGKVTVPPLQQDIPAALRLHDWVTDWPDQPWNTLPGDNTSVIKGHEALQSLSGSADPAGLQAIEVMQDGLKGQLDKLGAPEVALETGFDIHLADIATLGQKYSNLPLAGKSV